MRAGRAGARRRASARPGAPERQAGQHPGRARRRRGRAGPHVADRLRDHQAGRLAQRADGHRRVHGHTIDYIAPEQIQGRPVQRPRRHLFAGLRDV